MRKTYTYYPNVSKTKAFLFQSNLLDWWYNSKEIKEKRQFFWRPWILNNNSCYVILQGNRFFRDYSIFCVETVLRQTRAESVEKYFPEFFSDFTSFDDISLASSSELKRILEPLGRVNQNIRDLKERSDIIIKKYNSRVPKSKIEIRSIMKSAKRNRHIYFVEAIALYIHNIHGAPVDVNVERIYCNYFGIIRKKYGVQDDLDFCNFSATLVPETEPVSYNLALLDLGALICTSKNPKCFKCHLKAECIYYKNKYINKLGNFKES